MIKKLMLWYQSLRKEEREKLKLINHKINKSSDDLHKIRTELRELKSNIGTLIEKIDKIKR